MELNNDQVRHVANLARMRLTDAEVIKLGTQMTSILNYVEQLNEVNTDGVEPIRQITGLTNMTREDKVEQLAKPEDLLASSPLPKERNQIKVPPVF